MATKLLKDNKILTNTKTNITLKLKLVENLKKSDEEFRNNFRKLLNQSKQLVTRGRKPLDD